MDSSAAIRPGVAKKSRLETAVQQAVARAPATHRPAALEATRRRALELFLARGLPGPQEEAWRHTSLGEFSVRLVECLENPAAPAEPPAAESGLPDAATRLVFVDGRYMAGHCVGTDVPGLRISRLADPATGARCAAALAAEIERHGLDALGALNVALLDDALLIEIADGVELPHPLHLVLSASGADVAQQPHVLLRLGKDSRARVLLHHFGTGRTLSNGLFGFDCAAGSRLSCLRLQQESDAALQRTASRFTLAEGATLDLLTVDLGARLARHEAQVLLNGRGALAGVLGLFIVDGQRHVDNRSSLEHGAPDTTSRARFHGLIADHGHGVFNGRVLVHPEAAGADARLSNRNLLLSGTAEIDTKPELEIYTDDVKCAHGATTGQLDANAVFYLQSRGISCQEARGMLMSAFAQQILTEGAWPELREFLAAQLHAALPAAAAGVAG